MLQLRLVRKHGSLARRKSQDRCIESRLRNYSLSHLLSQYFVHPMHFQVLMLQFSHLFVVNVIVFPCEDFYNLIAGTLEDVQVE